MTPTTTFIDRQEDCDMLAYKELLRLQDDSVCFEIKKDIAGEIIKEGTDYESRCVHEEMDALLEECAEEFTELDAKGWACGVKVLGKLKQAGYGATLGITVKGE